ncbi:DUF2189 domain-containing protein [Chitinibacteraceae bacterium HSL-7]
MDMHLDGLDQHFTLPKTRKVSASRPLAWLAAGWRDFIAHPGPSLAWGVMVALVGGLMLKIAASYPYLFTFCITTFLLLAPLVAAGIYELTSEREQGRPTSFVQSVRDFLGNVGQIAFFGVILGMIALAWERISAILFALFYGGDAVSIEHFFQALTGEYATFTLSWALVGALLAAAVFAMTAVSIPMLADRQVDAITAMMTSIRCVAENLPAMLLWAVLIVALTALGFATALIGLIVIFPVLGHATWVAYKELVE